MIAKGDKKWCDKLGIIGDISVLSAAHGLKLAMRFTKDDYIDCHMRNGLEDLHQSLTKKEALALADYIYEVYGKGGER